MKKFPALSLSEVAFIMLINVKMLAIVGILTFMSMINFMLSMKNVFLPRDLVVLLLLCY